MNKGKLNRQLGQKIFLLDGAMGTVLLQSGVKIGTALEELNLK